jgi:hypothetical protein
MTNNKLWTKEIKIVGTEVAILKNRKLKKVKGGREK